MKRLVPHLKFVHNIDRDTQLFDAYLKLVRAQALNAKRAAKDADNHSSKCRKSFHKMRNESEETDDNTIKKVVLSDTASGTVNRSNRRHNVGAVIYAASDYKRFKSVDVKHNTYAACSATRQPRGNREKWRRTNSKDIGHASR